MKTQEDLRKELDLAYCAAADQAGIESWNKLAELVGIPYPTIFRVLKGGKLTESLLQRIQMTLAQKGIHIEGSPYASAQNINAQNINAPTAKNVTAPVTQTTTDERWFELVAEKDRQIDRLLGIIENIHK